MPATILLALLLLAAPAPGQEVSRGLVLMPEEAEGDSTRLYSSSHALLLGAAGYRRGWSPLPEVRGDCDAVAEALAAHGFTVTRVDDPDRAGVLEALEGFRAGAGLDPEARLVVYFGGHGHSERDALLGEVGYLVPVDAPLPGEDPVGFARAAIEMGEIEAFAKRLRSKHVLFVLDACFAGTVFTTRSTTAAPEHIDHKTRRPVRQFLTAGDADEPVPAVSLFRRYLVRALEGEGDTNGDGYVTGTELGEYLHHRVAEESGGLQHPRSGKIRDVRFNAGDVVFVVPRTPAAAVERTPPALHVTPAPGRAARELELALDRLQGRGGPHDFPAAARHLLRSAEGGNLRAVALLADLCYSGVDEGGVDLEQAWRLVQPAAEGGDLYGRFLRAKLMQRGERGRDQVALGEALLRGLLPELEGAGREDPWCAYAAAYVLSAVEGDPAAAVGLHRRAAEAGILLAMLNLGAMHQEGRGVERSQDRALVWFLRAAELGETSAMNSLGAMFEEGRSVERDPAAAAEWYRRAAERGERMAMENLAWLYLEGSGVERDAALAHEWFLRSAERGRPSAMDQVGRMLEQGLGVPRDADAARRWRQRARDAGHGP